MNETLGFRYDDSHNSRWWLKDKSVVPAVRSVLTAIDECDGPSTHPDCEILKQLPDRLILRVRPPDSAPQSFVAKISLLPHLRERLKYHIMKNDRFGFAEAANLIIAAQRGLTVPGVYGYGRIYGPFGLIRKSIVILEDLAHHVTIGKLLDLNRQNQSRCADMLGWTIPVFVGLYNANCNHIDVNLNSIMFDSKDDNKRGFLLDFEYARFYDKPSIEILMFEAAHFAKCCPDRLKGDTINNWLAKLLDAVEIREALSREKAIDRFNCYYSSGRLSRKERVRIH
ncbi:MAG: lipopolysaccharide kinase InaA family protein [Sedimentisphaerales bacterium]